MWSPTSDQVQRAWWRCKGISETGTGKTWTPMWAERAPIGPKCDLPTSTNARAAVRLPRALSGRRVDGCRIATRYTLRYGFWKAGEKYWP